MTPLSAMEPQAAVGHPWDRQPDEPALWYDRFHTYLMISSDRSIERAFQASQRKSAKTSKSRPAKQWYSAFRQWNWESRSHAYDEMLRAEVRREREQSCREMNQRHAIMARGVFAKLARRLNAVTDEELAEVSFGQVVRLTEIAIRFERLARGEPITIQAYEHAGPGGTPIRPIQEVQTFKPDAALLAQVMEILDKHVPLEEETDENDVPDTLSIDREVRVG